MSNPPPTDAGAHELSEPPHAPSLMFGDDTAPPPVGASEHQQPAQHTDAPADPRLATLKPMFPDLDDTILLTVLESVNFDEARAVDVLLGMSDPSFVPEHRQSVPERDETDEEMARRIAAEEEFHAAWQPQVDTPVGGRGRGRGIAVPPPPPGSNQGDFNDTLNQVGDQVMKFADVGKKTFLSFASKVKQKWQEFETSNNTNPRARDWEDPTYPSDRAHAAETSQALYDHAVNVPYRPPPGQQYTPTPQQEVRGFDVSGEPSRPISEAPGPTAPISIPAKSGGSSPGPASYDAARLGVLPKRGISLMDATTTPKSQKATVEDDDEVEYEESPFKDP